MGPSGKAREQESETLTPLAKTRAALVRKAARGEVQAARELRENADHYHGSASGATHWPQLLGHGGVAVEVPVSAGACDSAGHHRGSPEAARPASE